jgi:hypothetical protein
VYVHVNWFGVAVAAQVLVELVRTAASADGAYATAPTTAASATSAASQPIFESLNVSS